MTEDLELNMAYSLGLEPNDVGREPVGGGGRGMKNLMMVNIDRNL